MANRNQALSRDGSKLGRDRILAVAKHLFATQGFDETGTLEIARTANVSHSFLVNQFGNKGQLLVELLDTGWSPITKRIRGVSLVPDPEKRLIRALELLLDSWQRDTEAAELMLLEGRRVSGRHAIVGRCSGLANCVAILDQYVAQFRTRWTSPGELSNAAIRSSLMGLVEGLFLNEKLYSRIGFPTPATHKEARKIISLFVNALNLNQSIISTQSAELEAKC